MLKHYRLRCWRNVFTRGVDDVGGRLNATTLADTTDCYLFDFLTAAVL